MTDTLMIKTACADLLERFEYGREAVSVILKNYDAVTAHRYAAELLCSHAEAYGEGRLDFGALNDDAKAAAELCGISEYECRLVFYIALLPYSKPYYDRAGLSETVWYDSILDFKWKMLECLDIYGTYGIFSPWMGRWFTAERAAFGRLEFDLTEAKTDYTSGEVYVKRGDTVVAVHIPSRSRYSFTVESCRESYRQAYEYFKGRIGSPVVFSCCSWMIWSENARLLPETSGIRAFASDYDLTADYDGSGHLWRIYGRTDCSDVASLPENTSLQRIYKRYMRERGAIGVSQGYFCYEQRFCSTNI